LNSDKIHLIIKKLENILLKNIWIGIGILNEKILNILSKINIQYFKNNMTIKEITKNKKAFFDYEIIQTYEAGLKLF